ncbi:hypothetical protein AAG570_013938 [Ranatra chinensis]|uniref:Endosome-associated-trafficking regulator 1 n=1 Tax=Ranatra chinensis TaxID=642074 RepID=A0ABD0YDX3_9HEMI
MADDGRREGDLPRKNYYWGKNKDGAGHREQSDMHVDDEDQTRRPDIASHHRNSQPESSPAPVAGSSSSDSLRDSNPPFSFKHFLSRSSSGSVSVARGGARPKVYPPPSTPPPSPQPPLPPRLLPNPEVTGLPDFVQDHLVIEQCYLNTSTPPHLAVDLDNIPPPGSPDCEFGPCGLSRPDIPFDLTRRERCTVGEVPLDLPHPQVMPLDVAEQVITSPSSSHHHQQEQQASSLQQQHPLPPIPQHPPEVVGSSKSLPDFLSDGPMIRSERRVADQGIPSDPGSPTLSHTDSRHSPNNRLHIENERLRREVDSLRRMLSDQIARTESLESELVILRNRDQSDVAALEKVFEQVEDNLKRTTKRAITAESQVAKLKEDVRTLTNQLNSITRNREGAASSSAHQTDNERLASQLRNAANTAELSLRHLLLGVDNLRQLAASLEPQMTASTSSASRPRLSSSSDDSQDDNQAGPAL